jgi:hypothetical protein
VGFLFVYRKKINNHTRGEQMKLKLDDKTLLDIILKDTKTNRQRMTAGILRKLGKLVSQENKRKEFSKINPATGEQMYADYIVMDYENAIVTTTQYGKIVKLVFKKQQTRTAKATVVTKPTIIIKKKRVFNKNE